MSNQTDAINVLESQITEISDTQKNLVGLIEKTTRVQTELMTAGFDKFSDAVGEPFSAMSQAAENLTRIQHDIETERNRIRNEG